MKVKWKSPGSDVIHTVPEHAAIVFEFNEENFATIYFSKDTDDTDVLVIKRYFDGEEIYQDIIKEEDGTE